MYRPKSVFVTTLASALISSCASQLTVTYHSMPEGAVVYQGKQPFGYTPVTLNYVPSEDLKKGGCMKLNPIGVRWVSGASAQSKGISACAAQGLNQQFTFNRPESAPGASSDFQFALELERNAILRQQAEAADQSAFYQSLNAIQQRNRQSQPTTCDSTVMGNMINTTCR